jgi:hypothetical protein
MRRAEHRVRNPSTYNKSAEQVFGQGKLTSKLLLIGGSVPWHNRLLPEYPCSGEAIEREEFSVGQVHFPPRHPVKRLGGNTHREGKCCTCRGSHRRHTFRTTRNARAIVLTLPRHQPPKQQVGCRSNALSSGSPFTSCGHRRSV